MATAADTAGGFGYSLAFFNSDPELASLLARASAGEYTAGRFTAELQNTNWFRTKSESMRKYTALQSTDPSTFNAQLKQQATHIATLSQQMGALASPSNVSTLADEAMKFGWNDEQLKQMLAHYIKPTSAGYTGQAGQLQWQYKQLASDYGVSLSDATLNTWVKGGVLGTMTTEGVKTNLLNQAASRYPSFKDRLQSGETIRQIADPYVQSQAKMLELNPQTINLTDPLIQQALASKDSKGQPASKTVWQFEQDLRNDPRWTKTQNAQDSFMATANSVLKGFGVVS